MKHPRLRCLVADDARHIAARVGDMLTDSGAEVVGMAFDGLQAVDLFDRLAPDAAVLDFDMPGLDGLAVTRAIREREQRGGSLTRCLVVILTSHTEASIRERCLAEGADHFLHKASDFDRLGSVVCSAAQNQQRCSSSSNPAMTKLKLRLFVTGNTEQSRRAISNLDRICEAELPGRYEVEVIDVLEHPEQAEQARILATPTLVRQLPGPARKIIGDLSDREKVLLGLDLAGLANNPLR